MSLSNATIADKLLVIGRALQIGSSIFIDRATPRKVKNKDEIPGSVNQITCEWLTEVLCSNIPGAKVIDFQITGGDFGTTTRASLELELNDPAREGGIPQHLFSKCPAIFTQRLFHSFTGALVGEPFFYNVIRPQLNIEAPVGRYAGVNTSSWRCMILMEDLRITKGAKFISTETYIDRKMMQDLLGNMAKWHGYFWETEQFSTCFSGINNTRNFIAQLNKFVDLKSRADFDRKISVSGTRKHAFRK